MKILIVGDDHTSISTFDQFNQHTLIILHLGHQHLGSVCHINIDDESFSRDVGQTRPLSTLGGDRGGQSGIHPW